MTSQASFDYRHCFIEGEANRSMLQVIGCDILSFREIRETVNGDMIANIRV